MASIFSRIISGEIPSYKIAENEHCYAFLDINPLVKGHTLVVPRTEVDYLFDLDDETTTQLHLFARQVAKAIDKTIECKRVGVIVIGTEVPHAHIHLVPFQQEAEIDITRPKLKISSEEMAAIAERIAAAYQS